MKSGDQQLILGGIVDVETTGLSPSQDEIIELCIVLFSFDYRKGQIVRIEEEYVGLREPACDIHPAAARINGLTLVDVCGKDLDYERVADLIERADFLIAHNASFDRNFLACLFPEIRAKTWYCSMAGINWKGKGYPNRGLQDLLYHHRIVPERTHRASDDVYATLELLSYRQDGGTTYMSELLFGTRAQ
jgi:DNA polymerase III subunit epsilon